MKTGYSILLGEHITPRAVLTREEAVFFDKVSSNAMTSIDAMSKFFPELDRFTVYARMVSLGNKGLLTVVNLNENCDIWVCNGDEYDLEEQ